LPTGGGDLDRLVGVGQDGALDLMALDLRDHRGRVYLLVGLAGPGQPEDEQEHNDNKEDGEHPSAEDALQIHRRTAPLVSGRSLLTIPMPRRLPAELPCVPAFTLGFLNYVASPARRQRGITDGTPARQ